MPFLIFLTLQVLPSEVCKIVDESYCFVITLLHFTF
jgi:hypothetical protein